MSTEQLREVTRALSVLDAETLTHLDDEQLWNFTERLSWWKERAEELLVSGSNQRLLFRSGLETGQTYRFVLEAGPGQTENPSSAWVFCGEIHRGRERYYAVRGKGGDHRLVNVNTVLSVELERE